MISELCEAGNTPPVDLLPILAYIPDMFVGNWKARCVTVDRMNRELLWSLLRNAEKRLEEERAVHPEAPKAVHEEIDRVIGVNRVPTLDDMPNLPQINAFIRETHRFRPIAPLGPPHQAMEDQFYQGKLIPKGSTIFMNTWAMFHDPDLYDQPDVFDPSRFIRSPYGTKEGVEKTISEEALKRLETMAFGAGSRKCVGMPIAIEATTLITANLFWVFEFGHFVDNEGNRIEPDLWAFKIVRGVYSRMHFVSSGISTSELDSVEISRAIGPFRAVTVTSTSHFLSPFVSP
ncbi:hypothetical protein FRC03_012493 [Tulasnella sp. 419]|nr:hypothetical protein FRC03_012493 [Tulasnella sp. 419]